MRKRITLMFFALFAVHAAFAYAIYNLSGLPDGMEEITLNNGDVLTGTLDGSKKCQIFINDGASITLENVHILGADNNQWQWAGIICLGNCTITLMGTNTVRGNDRNYPGIQAAKRVGEGGEYTLKIKGSGSLNASSNGQAAGIGGGYNLSCGNITIESGTITATGGKYSAAIGGGYNATCGNITIDKDAKVVAIKGDSAPNCIGKGSGETASVGIVTIGDAVGAIEKETFLLRAGIAEIVTAGSQKYGILDGDYNGSDALKFSYDTNVDKVYFNRTFPAVSGDDNYSTIMFPFEIKFKEVGGIKQVLSFLGIGADSDNHKYVAVERVWCDEDGTTCNNDAILEAYKPYLIQLKAGATNLTINNTSQLVLKATPSEFDVMQNADYSQYGNYVFRGVLQGKTWGADDADILGTDKAASYGFAAASTTDISVGQFVKVAEGAHIKPFRAYIYKSPIPQNARANDSFAKHHAASIDGDIPEVMRIFIVDSKENGGATDIGQFNSRTGEIRLDRTDSTYDLQGRKFSGMPTKKGVYINNGVKRVIK